MPYDIDPNYMQYNTYAFCTHCPKQCPCAAEIGNGKMRPTTEHSALYCQIEREEECCLYKPKRQKIAEIKNPPSTVISLKSNRSHTTHSMLQNTTTTGSKEIAPVKPPGRQVVVKVDVIRSSVVHHPAVLVIPRTRQELDEYCQWVTERFGLSSASKNEFGRYESNY